MTIPNKYHIGQIVYLVTDEEQKQRIVIGIKVNPGNTLLYYLGCAEDETIHAEIEISSDKNYKI